MPGPLKKVQSFPGLDALGPSMKGLVETLFPPDDVGLPVGIMGVPGGNGLGWLRGLLKRAPEATHGPPRVPLGAIDPHFTPVGEEATLNATRVPPKVPEGVQNGPNYQQMFEGRKMTPLVETKVPKVGEENIVGSPLFDRLEGAGFDSAQGIKDPVNDDLLKRYLAPWLEKLKR